MKTKKQIPDFLHLGQKLLYWYNINGRDLPFRKTKDPYKIWICEIIFQQTRIEKGMTHYHNFIERFPTVECLYKADVDEVLLYWKGLGYYSRAINLHKTSVIIVEKYKGIFPKNYSEILLLPGIGKYTAAAICSICYGENYPSIDGNFYRVLSRLLGDGFDISNHNSFQYFASLATKLMPIEESGKFNQAMMDLGATVCKVKNPNCKDCPFSNDCIAFLSDKIHSYPVKSKKTKIINEELEYYFIHHGQQLLIEQRDDKGIWKKLFQLPTDLPANFAMEIISSEKINHNLTHRRLSITIHEVQIDSAQTFVEINEWYQSKIISNNEISKYSFPKPLDKYLKTRLLPPKKD
ncbi:MAG: A/G-specific adenine glycosylase [Bacteroidetes bacterium]|nr:A/G-specific adenine glycosylase [Bacteroidota bacterium]